MIVTGLITSIKMYLSSRIIRKELAEQNHNFNFFGL